MLPFLFFLLMGSNPLSPCFVRDHQLERQLTGRCHQREELRSLLAEECQGLVEDVCVFIPAEVIYDMSCTCAWSPCVFCHVWLHVCASQQLRMGLFLSGLNGKTVLSESALPLWGPSVATAWMTTHTHVNACYNTHTPCSQKRVETHLYIFTDTHLPDSCPVLQDVQIGKHIDNIWTWTELRKVTDTECRNWTHLDASIWYF